MKKPSIARNAILSGLFLLAACSPENAESVDAGPFAPAAAESGPAMWKVTDEDSTIYLFGTFHILPSESRWTTKAFDEAMAETAVTVIEVDTKSAEAQQAMSALVTELGLNPDGVTLSATLGKKRAARFAAIAERYNLSMASFERLKPWLAMITLSVSIMQAEGLAAENGAEEVILQRAGSEGDRIAHLESAEYQLRALASLDEEEILADFDASLQDFEDFDAYARRVLSAWQKGDIDALERETLTAMRNEAPDAFRIMIKDRNFNWVREIEEMMAGNDDYFIAVGAGHLIGDESVVDLLAEKGFTVSRVQ